MRMIEGDRLHEEDWWRILLLVDLTQKGNFGSKNPSTNACTAFELKSSESERSPADSC